MKKIICSVFAFLCLSFTAFADDQATHTFHVEKSTAIFGSPSFVWEQLAKIDDLSWFPGVVKVELVPPGAFEVGASRIIHLDDEKTVLTEVVRQIDVNKTLAYGIVQGLPFPELLVQFKIAPLSETETSVSIVADGVSFPMPKEEFEGFAAHVSGLYEQALTNLKTKLESQN